MRPPRTQFHESLRLQFPFVFRRLQSLQLLLPARPCFLFQLALSFLASLGFHFHGLAPLPLLFLTSAVFAPFRSLQFWVLTTQPLFLPFPASCLRLTVASSVRRSRFRSFGFPRSVLPGFPCILSRFWYSASPYVSFRPSLIRSHGRSSGACFRIFRSASASFRPLPLSFRLLSFLFLPFRSSRFCLSVASSVLPLRFRFLAFPVLPGLISHAFFPGSRTRLCCLFPFVLPCFAPAAVPQVIPFWFFLRGRCLTSAFFRLLPF